LQGAAAASGGPEESKDSYKAPREPRICAEVENGASPEALTVFLSAAPWFSVAFV
jgi:hypothetical protein